MVSARVLDKTTALAAHPLFGQLTVEERERLGTYMRVVRCPAQTVLFRKGDPGTNMMMVLRGRVKVCSHSEEGKELTFATFQAGDVFGEIAMLDGSERTADAVALDDCELLVLEKRDFLPFISRHPETCLRMFAVLCERIRRTSEQLEEALFLEGPARLAKRLVRLAETFGKPDPRGTRIDLQLSQQQLGNMIGMSRESMNKQLGQWRRDELISTEGRYITITDLDRLRQL